MTDSVPSAFDDIEPSEEQEYVSGRILEFSGGDGLGIRSSYDPSLMREEVDESRFEILARSSRAHFEWRRRIGTYIAREVLHKPVDNTGYILRDFPEGYELLVHTRAQSRGIYLYGPSRRIRFRTLNEFEPHARWLYENNGAVCSCMYCSPPTPQNEISATLDLDRPRITSACNPGCAMKQISIADPQSYAQHSHLTALSLGVAASEGSFHETPLPVSAPFFREHEVVWVKLDAPIRSADDTRIALSHWPGLIVARHRDACPEGGAERHMVELFCSPMKQLFGAHKLLPFRGFLPGESLKIVLEQTRFSERPDINRIRGFCPFQGNSGEKPRPHTLEDALIPFTWAIYTAIYMNAFFIPIGRTDSWDNSPFSSRRMGSFYEALWWGPEKILLGDMLRMKPAIGDYPASVASILDQSPDGGVAVARDLLRPTFCRIRSIYINSQAPDSSHCTISGTLYEAVPDPLPLHRSMTQDASMTDHCTEVPDWHRESYGLPKPPPTKKWKRLTPVGQELSCSAELIAGRYYPMILSHPLVRIDANENKIKDYLRLPSENILPSEEMESCALHLSLAGLECGWMGTMFKSRLPLDTMSAIIEAAEQLAERHLHSH